MAKHKLYVSRTHGKPDLVIWRCAKCPRYVELTRFAVYEILVLRSRMLVRHAPEEQETIKAWSICKEAR